MAGVRMERLSAYLATSARRRIDYASWDCASGFVAGWIEQERGVDAAKPWRGLYACADTCLALLQASGGLAEVMARGAALVGLEQVQRPRLGDVAALSVKTPDGSDQAAGIRTRIGWAVMTPRGLAVINAPVIAAWEV